VKSLKPHLIAIEIVMGPGSTFLTQVGSGQPTLGLENFPARIPNFQLLVQKNLESASKITGSKTGRFLVYFGLKVCSGQVRAHLYKEKIFQMMQ